MSKEETTGADSAKLEHIRGKSLQVVLYGLPTNLNKKQMHKYLTHEMKMRKVDVELLIEEGLVAKYPWGRSMVITVSAKKDVQPIVKKFDGMTIKMLEKAITEMENRIDAGGKPFEAQSENQFVKCRCVVDVDMANLDRRKQFCRVIIRNLSFQAQFEHIAKKMVKFGPIVDISLPVAQISGKMSTKQGAADTDGVSESTDAAQRGGNVKHRGFAFVTFLCQKDAEAVIAQQAGTAPAVDGQGRKAPATAVQICNREVAIDFCDHKSGFERKKMLKTLSNEAEEEADKALDGAEVSENVVSVHGENVAPESGDEEDDQEGDGEAEGGLEGSSVGMSVDDEDQDEASDNEGSSAAAEDATTLDDAQEGRTVFVRDLSLDTTRAELWREMHLLMPDCRLVSAFIVRDRITGLPKGSAFVKFASAEDAQRCADEHSQCTIGDRSCRVDMALDRGGVERVLEEQKTQVRDKRHVYLLTEGVIPEAETGDSKGKGKKGGKGKEEAVGVTGFAPDMQWASTMSLEDREKRQRAQLEKKKKLVNPLFFVSPVRLSLRNLHKDLDDRALKAMLLRATRSGVEKVLAGPKDMELLHTASMTRVNSNPGSVHNNVTVPAIVSLPKGTAPGRHQIVVKDVIVSVKVMCDSEKLDKVTQAPASKGYGFVEFRHHGHALACLRELNNNPAYSFNCVGAKELTHASAKGKEKEKKDDEDEDTAAHAPRRGNSKHRPIVEFAIENARKVQILERRKEAQKEREVAPVGASGNAAGATVGSKRKAESEEVEEDGTTFIRPPTGTPANAKKSKKALALEAGENGPRPVKGKEDGASVNKQLKRKERKLKRKQVRLEKKSTRVATAAVQESNSIPDKKTKSETKLETKAKVEAPARIEKLSNKKRLRVQKS